MAYHVGGLGHRTIREIVRELVGTGRRVGDLSGSGNGTGSGTGKWGEIRKEPNETVTVSPTSAPGESETRL